MNGRGENRGTDFRFSVGRLRDSDVAGVAPLFDQDRFIVTNDEQRAVVAQWNIWVEVLDMLSVRKEAFRKFFGDDAAVREKAVDMLVGIILVRVRSQIAFTPRPTGALPDNNFAVRLAEFDIREGFGLAEDLLQGMYFERFGQTCNCDEVLSLVRWGTKLQENTEEFMNYRNDYSDFSVSRKITLTMFVHYRRSITSDRIGRSLHTEDTYIQGKALVVLQLFLEYARQSL